MVGGDQCAVHAKRRLLEDEQSQTPPVLRCLLLASPHDFAKCDLSFILFHDNRQPRDLGLPQVGLFLEPITQRNMPPSTPRQADHFGEAATMQHGRETVNQGWSALRVNQG
jgi:hypothetical protein